MPPLFGQDHPLLHQGLEESACNLLDTDQGGEGNTSTSCRAWMWWDEGEATSLYLSRLPIDLSLPKGRAQDIVPQQGRPPPQTFSYYGQVGKWEKWGSQFPLHSRKCEDKERSNRYSKPINNRQRTRIPTERYGYLCYSVWWEGHLVLYWNPWLDSSKYWGYKKPKVSPRQRKIPRLLWS